MKRKFVIVLLVLLVLAACNQTPKTNVLDSSLPIGDEALAAAELIPELEPVEPEALIALAIKPNLADLPSKGNKAAPLKLSNDSWREALSNLSIDTQGSYPASTGFAVFIQRIAADAEATPARSKIIRIDMATGEKSILYEGAAEPESAAISSDGKYVLFTAQLEGNLEVFIYNERETDTNQGVLSRLTATEADETNVSMSLSGDSLMWQAPGSADQETAVSASISDGKSSITTVDFALGEGAPPLSLLEPSLSGDGNSFVLVVNEGLEGLDIDFPVLISFTPDGVFFAYADPGVESLSAPSMSYAAESFLVSEVYLGNAYITQLAGDSFNSFFIDAQHPHLTAGGGSFIYSANGTLFTANSLGEPGTTVSVIDGLVDESAYWARNASFSEDGREIYMGSLSENSASFVRPDNGSGLSDEERTVFYSEQSFSVSFLSRYAIFSAQNYDGYLLLYEDSFDPANPTENLIAQNDDYPSFFDAETETGSSRIIEVLDPAQTYILVTTAFGSADVSEPYHVGTFTTTISAGAAPPPPPIELPESDPTQFNITVIFSPDEITASLTDEQKNVFIEAAERWSGIITEDISDVEDFSLPSEVIFPGVGEIKGTVDDVIILARFAELNGPLGSAGPVFIRTKDAANPFLPIVGLMQFEIGEFGEGGFFNDPQQYEDVIVHEMGHVIGIGTLWEATGNVDGNYIASDPPTVSPGLPNPNYDPGFTGELAVAEYSTLTGTTETTVPIANTGGPGNYNGHWRELVFNNELMTPYAGGAELLSRMTAASLGDIGYVVNIDSAAVAQDYELTREVGTLEQVNPEQVSYTQFEDFLIFSGSIEADVTATVQAVDINLAPPRASSSGCEAEDFADFTAGNIALLQRGTCPFVDKVANAEAAGAVAVVMFNQGDSDDVSRSGIFRGISNSDIPALGTTFALGETFAGIEALELRVAVTVESGPLVTAATKPSFKEELIRPIATISSGGLIEYLDNYVPIIQKTP